MRRAGRAGPDPALRAEVERVGRELAEVRAAVAEFHVRAAEEARRVDQPVASRNVEVAR